MAPPAAVDLQNAPSSGMDRALAAGIRLSSPEPGEEVVITGLSGQFPESDNVYEFRDKLLNKVDLVTDDNRRWAKDHPEIPQRTGKINNAQKFDASFFGVHYKQAHTMDPMCRMLMEKAYEAVVDAGLNPRQLRGTKTGVFVGACFSESEKTWFYEKLQVNGFGITGCSRAMLSNRISYWLGTNGPSYTIDTACSSSLYALEHAYKAIREGHCDAALVGGCNLCLHPLVSLQFYKLGVLSPEGKCRTFDANGTGYARSEAVSFVLLQKSKDAKRIYCRMIHGKTNCDGFKEQGITFPSTELQARLMGDFYRECRYKPSELAYLEAHGTGTPIGDPAEGLAIENVFLEGRTKPLLVGSVKSNMGHSEPASGLCSIAKIIIAFETGIIPPNLHYEKPRPGMKAIEDGRMKVVSEKTPLEGDLIACNSFGFGGANCHVLLERNKKQKINKGQPADDLPRIFAVSGRTEEAISTILDDLEIRPLDAEYARLIHDIHSEDIPGHVYRGYSLMECGKDGGNGVKLSRDCMYFSGARRPVCFVFSGMGSQWAGMGAQLMRLPIFAAAIQKCHKVLEPRGVNLTEIITNPDPKIFDNILHSFVGIAAVQVGLCDVLKALEIVPDIIIGHSVGELGCAYADGCFTAEEMVLSAYSRGLASIETELIKGSMAAVGVGYKTIKDLCPPGIEVACHNGPDSSTISGPAEQMKDFVAQLQAKGIFAREVPCSNIAYHSKYIASAGPTLLKYLKQVIPEPKLRSPKWLSSSVPKDKWDEPQAKYSSPEYHTNNLLSAVLFEETSRLIPSNAITVEIAPHGLLQAILKRSLKKDVTNIALTRRGDKDNIQVLFNGIGKLFEVGLNPKISVLYPEVKFPVSRGTPMISPLIKWEHSDDWYLIKYCTQEKIRSGERTVTISAETEDFKYLKGHVIDGRNLFPATGYLHLVWESLALMRNETPEGYSVIFENVKFLRATNIPTGAENLQLIVMIQRGTGNFEIIEGNAAVVSGRVRSVEDDEVGSVDLEPLPNKDSADEMMLKSKDIYKELRLRGYNYNGLFRGMVSANSRGTECRIKWSKNYTAFMDNMLQLQLLGKDTRDLYVPTEIQRLTIDVPKHTKFVEDLPEDEALEVHYYPELGILKGGGIEIRGLTARSIPKKKILTEPVIEKYQFVPHFDMGEKELSVIARINAQLILEVKNEVKVKLVEYHQPNTKPFITEMVNAFGDLPLVRTEATIISDSTQQELNLGNGITILERKAKRDNGHLIYIGRNLLNDRQQLNEALAAIVQDGFIISLESKDATTAPEGLQIITSQKDGKENIIVLNRVKELEKPVTVEIRNDDVKFNWVLTLQKLITTEKNIILYSQEQPTSGILGLVNCLRREPGGTVIRCVFVLDTNTIKFNVDHAMYKKQLDLGLPINVFQYGKWGSYRHLLLEKSPLVTVEYAHVNNLVRADLSTLSWIQGPLNSNTKVLPNQEFIQIYYSALNFRDIMLASGKLSNDVVGHSRLTQECVQGFEFSGKTKEGRRVMGMVPSQALSTAVLAGKELLWDVPENWSLEEAATVPVVYATAYYAMVLVGNMKRGMKVLIHAGSGGVGQAAINIALNGGCEVFTTVGTPEKRDFIKRQYPQIDDAHIGNSRDTTFEQLVLAGTKGKGVDMVLNSLAEEKLQASVRCLARGGKFLEIGKFDLANNNPLGMGTFLRETSFNAIMLDNLFHDPDVELTKKLRDLLYSGIKCGAVKPLPTTVFKEDEVEKAYKFMAQGKHIGKVLVKVRDEEPANLRNRPPVPRTIEAIRRFGCEPNHCYVVCGGLGGFGLELIDWLVIRGARKIVITSRRGITDGYQSTRIQVWKNYGATVVVKSGDFTSEKGACDLLKESGKLGPVVAIFNLAVILRDAILENQTVETFEESFNPKAKYTLALDKASRRYCPQLKHFVVFSSVVSGKGNGGQSNYGFANSIMERICEQRRLDNLPGLAVQWGAIGEVGLVAEMQEAYKEGDVFDLEIGGTLQQRIASCLQVLDDFLTNPDTPPVVSSIVVAEKRESDLGTTILEVIGNLLGVKDPKSVGIHTTLSDLGMDSMTGVEIKQALEREFEIFLSPAEIRHLTFGRLKDMSDQREAKMSVNVDVDAKDVKLEDIGIYMKKIEDELIACKPVVRLPSKADNGKETEDSNEAIFFIPGVEGVASTMKPLAANLEKQVLGLQMGHESTTTIENAAKHLYTLMAPRLRGRSTFHVVGYSLGTTAALELCRLLESAGYRGRLTFLDGAPDFIRRLANTHFAVAEEERFHDTILLTIIQGIQPQEVPRMQTLLPTFKTWEEKVELLLSYTDDEGIKEYQRRAINECKARIEAVIEYNPENGQKRRIESKVTLIRPKAILLPDMEKDYGLSRLCAHTPEVYFINGDHRSMLEQQECAEIINRMEAEVQDSQTGKAFSNATVLINNSQEVTTNGDKGKN